MSGWLHAPPPWKFSSAPSAERLQVAANTESTIHGSQQTMRKYNEEVGPELERGLGTRAEGGKGYVPPAAIAVHF